MEKIVYAMKTSSGTFIANNMNHHNCNRYKNGNYAVYEPKIKAELGVDEVQKLWDKAYDKTKISTIELAEMLTQIKKDYKALIEERKRKGYKT